MALRGESQDHFTQLSNLIRSTSTQVTQSISRTSVASKTRTSIPLQKNKVKEEKETKMKQKIHWCMHPLEEKVETLAEASISN